MHHVHPEVRHRLVKRRAAGILSHFVADPAATGARGVLNKLFDALKDQLHALSAAVLLQQHKSNAEMRVVVPIVECVIRELGQKSAVRFIHSRQPFFQLNFQSSAE